MSDDDNFKTESEVKSRKDRKTGSAHFGDTDFADETVDEIGDASWGEVCQACCIHTPQEWGFIFIGVIGVLFFLYFFLLGLNLLGSSAKVMGGCAAGALFDDDTNPIAGIMVGILCTVLVQSSSSTTSIIVSLAGAEVVTVKTGIYMVMGANIGTSVTNTIVCMGHMGNGDELERAFAGATVHDMFNILTVLVMAPIELITGLLYYMTKAMVQGHEDPDKKKWEGPIKKIVGPLGKKIIIANKNIPKELAAEKYDSCDAYYPVNCTDGVSYDTCNVGLIACNKNDGSCPAFFQEGATRSDDVISGVVVFVMAIVILIICLIGLVTLLQKMLLGASTRIIYKATNLPGIVSIVIGAGITVLVQSSSITTSVLTPIVGVGAIRLEQMLPLTLGANIGTTVTGLLASLVSDGIDGLQVALCHLFFNIFGILIWYPIPFMRKIPLEAARTLGRVTRIWRGFPILYIFICFFVIPLLLFGITSLFDQDSKGFTVLGSFLSAVLGLILIWFLWKWFKGGLKEKIISCFTNMQKRKTASNELPSDMEYLKSEIERLRIHTGLEEPRVEAEEEEV